MPFLEPHFHSSCLRVSSFLHGLFWFLIYRSFPEVELNLHDWLAVSLLEWFSLFFLYCFCFSLNLCPLYVSLSRMRKCWFSCLSWIGVLFSLLNHQVLVILKEKMERFFIGFHQVCVFIFFSLSKENF